MCLIAFGTINLKLKLYTVLKSIMVWYLYYSVSKFSLIAWYAYYSENTLETFQSNYQLCNTNKNIILYWMNNEIYPSSIWPDIVIPVAVANVIGCFETFSPPAETQGTFGLRFPRERLSAVQKLTSTRACQTVSWQSQCLCHSHLIWACPIL